MSVAGRERTSPPLVRLPPTIRACLFDLDGVLTDTAVLHAEAWKTTLDGFLRRHALRSGEAFVPLDRVRDYDQYIDGKPSADGVRSFLEGRRIELPEGGADDPRGTETIRGLAKRKNKVVLGLIKQRGVHAFAGSVRFVHAATDAGLRCAVVSGSTNCRTVLEAAGISALFEARVDALDAAREQLRGKPSPDTFLAAARLLETPPDAAAVFDDAVAGVSAGRAGEFGLVVGVNRRDRAEALKAGGADIVVSDLAELLES